MGPKSNIRQFRGCFEWPTIFLLPLVKEEPSASRQLKSIPDEGQTPGTRWSESPVGQDAVPKDDQYYQTREQCQYGRLMGQ